MNSIKYLFFMLFLTACSTGGAVHIKNTKLVKQYNHSNYGLVNETDSRYIMAKQNCESKVYTKPININGTEIKERKKLQEIFWAEVKKNYPKLQRSKIITDDETYDFIDSLPPYVLEIRKLSKNYFNCVSKDEGFRPGRGKIIDKRTGQELIADKSRKFYYVPVE